LGVSTNLKSGDEYRTDVLTYNI